MLLIKEHTCSMYKSSVILTRLIFCLSFIELCYLFNQLGRKFLFWVTSFLYSSKYKFSPETQSVIPIKYRKLSPTVYYHKSCFGHVTNLTLMLENTSYAKENSMHLHFKIICVYYTQV